MKYHAVLFMCDDLTRAEWVATSFKRHNPDIPLSVYNGGVDDAATRTRVVADHYEAGPNLWHANTVSPHGSFGYDFFERFYALAEMRDADFTVYLETDVQVNRAITQDPKWDISGVLSDAGAPCDQVAYEFWGVAPDSGPNARKAHTGCGGTAFSRNYFSKTRRNLPLVKKAYDTIPGCFYADLMATLLGRHSGCSYGDWIEVSSVFFSGRFDDDRNLYGVAPDLNATMVHGVKI